MTSPPLFFLDSPPSLTLGVVSKMSSFLLSKYPKKVENLKACKLFDLSFFVLFCCEDSRGGILIVANKNLAPIFIDGPSSFIEPFLSFLTTLDLSELSGYNLHRRIDFGISVGHILSYRRFLVVSGQEVVRFPHHNYVTSVQFHPTDSKLFLAGTFKSSILCWDIRTGNVSILF